MIATGLIAVSALCSCSRAQGDAGAMPANAQVAASNPVARAPGDALIGMWGGASGARCWADVIEFRAGEMTYQAAGGTSDLKTVKVRYREAGPAITQVVPESGAPTSYTSNDANHITDGAGCLYQRTD